MTVDNLRTIKRMQSILLALIAVWLLFVMAAICTLLLIYGRSTGVW